MKATFLQEPELEFGAGSHVDVRFGIANYGPFDRDQPSPAKTIRLGIVGNAEAVESVAKWLERCASGVPAKPSRQTNLFPKFPGYGEDSPFASSLVIEPRGQRSIKNTEIAQLRSIGDPDRLVEEAVGLMLAEVGYVAVQTTADVIICAVPAELLELLQGHEPLVPETDQDAPEHRGTKLDFRRVLKARAMALGKPIQIVLPATYGGRMKKRRQHASKQRRTLQDEATRAWNFFTALYYKRGGIPWRIPRDVSAFTTCYLGIAFFRSHDDEHLHTSVAQVFDERGHGLVIRGGPAVIDKDDRVPHLPHADARHIVLNALRLYRDEHKAYPARVVIHKSSRYTADERDGCLAAVKELDVDQADLLCCRRSFNRLFRRGAYPPLRGTVLSLDQRRHVLYSKGSVDFFQTYPGLYVPLPIEVEIETAEQAPEALLREMLALTKMNWNSTQFDHAEPITLVAASQVGDILRYLTPDEPIQPRYSFYM